MTEHLAVEVGDAARTITHRTLAGHWAVCSKPVSCDLLLHFPDATPAVLAAVPARVMLALLNVMDPPTYAREGGPQKWLNADGQFHRDYDLPALIDADGSSLFWYTHGRANREAGPAAITAHRYAYWRRGRMIGEIREGWREW